MITLMEDFGDSVKIRMHIDSSAAKGILERTGLHKIRHLDVDMLWMQDKVAKNVLEVNKVKGEHNIADLMTKHMGKSLVDRHMGNMRVYFREGRSEKAAQLHGVSESGDRRGSKDSWAERGSKGKWVRIHATPRRCLFTPLKVAKGPKEQGELSELRVTNGRFANGEQFTFVDQWASADNAHRILKQPWTGRTMFLTACA